MGWAIQCFSPLLPGQRNTDNHRRVHREGAGPAIVPKAFFVVRPSEERIVVRRSVFCSTPLYACWWPTTARGALHTFNACDIEGAPRTRIFKFGNLATSRRYFRICCTECLFLLTLNAFRAHLVKPGWNFENCLLWRLRNIFQKIVYGMYQA